MREQLKSYLDKTGVSISKISRAIGISQTALSQWLSGNYKGDNAKIEEAVKNFLDREKEKKSAPKKEIEFVTTQAARRGFETARFCHLDAELGVLYGDAGTGKTSLVKQYAAKHPDTILIEADLGFSAKILFRKLHEILGMDGKGNIHDLFEDVVEKLKDSGRFIIIDEAEHLPYRALELLRRVYDKAKIGILLVGMPRLVMNLRGKRGEYAQLYSRVGISTKLPVLAADDADRIVRSVITGGGGEIVKDFLEFSQGNARRLTKLLTRAQRISEINNCSISRKVVKTAMDMLVI